MKQNYIVWKSTKSLVILDEVKGLVFNKHSGQIVGFINIGDINNKLEETIDKPLELARLILKSVHVEDICLS